MAGQVSIDPSTLNLEAPSLVSQFAQKHPSEFARVLSHCDSVEARTILQSLPQASVIPVAAHLTQDIARDFLQEQERDQVVAWLHDATMDDAMRLVQRLPAQERAELVSRIPNAHRKRVLNRSLASGKDSVGEIADKDFLWFAASTRIDQVRAEIKKSSDRDAIESAIVVNDDDTVVGLLDYVSLTQAADDALVRTCAIHTTLIPIHARPQAVLYLEDWHRVNRLPVVDHESMPVGVLRWGQIAEMETAVDETEAKDQGIFYEILDTMIELGRDMLTAQGRQ